jgi:type IX secretion system PorP/SprF family membrane protein
MALTRLQWLGVEKHPNTQTFSVQSPFRSENMGLGFNLVNDKIGLEKRIIFNMDYSYRLKLKEDLFLRFGIKGGFTNYSNPLPFYSTYDPNDPNYMLEVSNKLMPNVGVGTFLSTSRYYLGVSVPGLVQSKFSITSNENFTITDYRQIYITGGRIFDLSTDVKFKPTLMTKIMKGSPFQYDLSANFLLKDKFWLGTMYRSGDAFGVMAQWIFKDSFRVGYTIDFTTTNIRKYQKGVHEIMVSYEIKWNKDIPPRYF